MNDTMRDEKIADLIDHIFIIHVQAWLAKTPEEREGHIRNIVSIRQQLRALDLPLKD